MKKSGYNYKMQGKEDKDKGFLSTESVVVVDLGNSNVVFGYFVNGKLRDELRFDTPRLPDVQGQGRNNDRVDNSVDGDVIQESGEDSVSKWYSGFLEEFLKIQALDVWIQSCGARVFVISSVVPDFTHDLVNFIKNFSLIKNLKILLIKGNHKVEVKNYDQDYVHREMGDDLAANAIAASYIWNLDFSKNNMAPYSSDHHLSNQSGSKIQQHWNDQRANSIVAKDDFGKDVKKYCLILDFGTITTLSLLELSELSRLSDLKSSSLCGLQKAHLDLYVDASASALMVGENSMNVKNLDGERGYEVFFYSRRSYLSIVMIPGIKTFLGSIFKNAARINQNDVSERRYFQKVDSIVFQGTDHSVNAGCYLGYLGMLRGIISKFRDEFMDHSFHIIATGGLVNLIENDLAEIDMVKRNLTLEGLYNFYREILFKE